MVEVPIMSAADEVRFLDDVRAALDVTSDEIARLRAENARLREALDEAGATLNGVLQYVPTGTTNGIVQEVIEKCDQLTGSSDA